MCTHQNQSCVLGPALHVGCICDRDLCVHLARGGARVALSKIYENKIDYGHVYPLTVSITPRTMAVVRVTDVGFLYYWTHFFYLTSNVNLLRSFFPPMAVLFFISPVHLFRGKFSEWIKIAKRVEYIKKSRHTFLKICETCRPIHDY